MPAPPANLIDDIAFMDCRGKAGGSRQGHGFDAIRRQGARRQNGGGYGQSE
jgi:hypothetical protein